MTNTASEVITTIQNVLSNLEQSPDYQRNEVQVKLINDIRLALSSDKPVFAFEASMGVDRTEAYLIGAIACSQASGKKTVISTSCASHLPGLIEKVKSIRVAFDESFEFEVVELGQATPDSDLYLMTHEHFANGVIFGGNGSLPRPSEAVYVFDEAHRLDEIVSSCSKTDFCIDFAYEVLNTIDADTSKIQNILVDIQHWIASRHRNLFINNPNHVFQYGVIPQDLLKLLDQLQLMVEKLTLSLPDSEQLSQLVLGISGFIHSSEGEVPLAKWIRFDGEDKYTLSAQPISIEKTMYQTVWSNHSGVLLTSSALKMTDSLSPTGTSFLRFLHSVGLDYSLSHVGSYESQDERFDLSTLLVPKLPFEVTSNEYGTWLKHNVFDYCRSFTGSLVVFTSNALMETVRTHIESTCTENSTLIQCEGDRPVNEIVKYHHKAIKQGYKSILFGSSEFIEKLGTIHHIDNLIFTRLPFSLPEDPAIKARADYEQALGHLPFYSMTLPKASLELNQTILNTIVKNDESNRCVIFDRRIVNKSYSDILLKSLPTIRMSIE